MCLYLWFNIEHSKAHTTKSGKREKWVKIIVVVCKILFIVYFFCLPSTHTQTHKKMHNRVYWTSKNTILVISHAKAIFFGSFNLVRIQTNGNVWTYYITEADLHGLCISIYSKFYYSYCTIRSRLDKPMEHKLTECPWF